jgi:glycosyltransferase involved in cell wall biosynthesis
VNTEIIKKWCKSHFLHLFWKQKSKYFMESKLPITAVILTFNEERNIRNCIDSLINWVDEIFVVDSFSTDKTLTILKEYTTVKVEQHDFENYSKQRNWAFSNLPISHDFIFNLDADHRATDDLRIELTNKFQQGIASDINGFMASRRTMFLGSWIKRGGHYPIYHGIIFRKNNGYCEEKDYDQHFVIEGKSEILKSNVIDIITESLTIFTARHNHWATLEAQDAIQLKKGSQNKTLLPNKHGNPMEVRRYQRLKYYSYPIFVRVFLYFFYRFFFKMGFLDGKNGLIFHFLQGFWFRFLVDAKIYEVEQNEKLKN